MRPVKAGTPSSMPCNYNPPGTSPFGPVSESPAPAPAAHWISPECWGGLIMNAGGVHRAAGGRQGELAAPAAGIGQGSNWGAELAGSLPCNRHSGDSCSQTQGGSIGGYAAGCRRCRRGCCWFCALGAAQMSTQQAFLPSLLHSLLRDNHGNL